MERFASDKWKKSTKHRLISASFKKSAECLSDQIGISGIGYITNDIDEFVDKGLENSELSYDQRRQLTNNYLIQLV